MVIQEGDESGLLAWKVAAGDAGRCCAAAAAPGTAGDGSGR